MRSFSRIRNQTQQGSQSVTSQIFPCRRSPHIEYKFPMESITPTAAASGTFLLGSDLPVRRLGYGTMRLVGEGTWGEPKDPAEARRVLLRAVELGVTFIDTADAYGPEVAERIIGETLYPYPSDLVIATKGGITRQGPARTEYVGRAGYLMQCVEMSLRRLKLDCIPLYQLHRIDPRTTLEGTRQDPPHRPQ
jgi:pyridoxine 4-dehydrogenase